MAVTLYNPGTSGAQAKVNMPVESVVVFPNTTKLPFGSIAVIVTETPVTSLGIGCCSYTYCIHALSLASETQGTPFGKSAFCCVCCVPAETSMTVPLITRGVPTHVAVSGAVTVVALGPCPKQ